MKKELGFIILLLTAFVGIKTAEAQNPLVKQWDKRFGGTSDDFFHYLQQTSDGGYLLGGYTESDSSGDISQHGWGGPDYWIIKIDSIGNKEWDKRFGGLSVDNMFTSFEETTDKGFIIGGYSASGVGGDKTEANWGYNDYWIIKIDSLGNKEWDKDFGGTDYDFLYSLQQTSDKGYILGGFSSSDSGGDKTQDRWDTVCMPSCNYDYWIVKVDSSGNKEWDKTFGGTGDDQLYSVRQSSDGGYILGGWSFSGISGDKTQNTWGVHDYWIIKIDSAGNKEWDKDFGGFSADYFTSLEQTTDGGYILGGISNSGIGGNKTEDTWGGTDYWILKIDSQGVKQWDKDFGGTGIESLFGNIIQTSDAGYLICGSSHSPMSGDKSENNLGLEQSWIVKADSNGNKQWDKTLFTNCDPYKVDFGTIAYQTKDGCYIIGNATSGGVGGDKTQSNWDMICTPFCTYDYWIIKFCDTILTTSVPIINHQSSTINIYPNPFSDEIIITNKNNEEAEVIVYDILSRVVAREKFTSTTIINTEQLSKGMYVVSLETERERMVRKFVKE